MYLVEHLRDIFLTPKTGNAFFTQNHMDTILTHICRTGIYRLSPTNDSAALDEFNPSDIFMFNSGHSVYFRKEYSCVHDTYVVEYEQTGSDLRRELITRESPRQGLR